MKKQVIALFTVAVLVGGLAQAKTWKPQFQDDYIIMGAPASGDRCGALTIKPKPGHRVLVTSTIWSGFKKSERTISQYTGKRSPSDAASSEFVPLPPSGLRVRFDWAGRSPQSHYRIYTYQQNKTTDFPVPVKAKDVVILEDVLFDRTCGGWARWAGATGADYGDLNMNKG